MAASPRYNLEEQYGEVTTDIRAVTPEPETDINVKRGLTWAVGGIVSGAVIAVAWFLYRLFEPGEGGDALTWGITEIIVTPFLALLYAAIGAVIGGCLGMGVGIIFMGIAAIKAARESAEEEEEVEEEPKKIRSRRMRESY